MIWHAYQPLNFTCCLCETRYGLATKWFIHGKTSIDFSNHHDLQYFSQDVRNVFYVNENTITTIGLDQHHIDRVICNKCCREIIEQLKDLLQ